MSLSPVPRGLLCGAVLGGQTSGDSRPTAAGWQSVLGEAFKLRPSPDEVRGTARPEATPAGHRVKGPGYGQKPRSQRV